jgi:hypothetical protein
VARDNKTGELLAAGTAFHKGKRSKHVFSIGLVVGKKSWRQGIGRALMRRLEQDAKQVLELKSTQGSSIMDVTVKVSQGFCDDRT